MLTVKKAQSAGPGRYSAGGGLYLLVKPDRHGKRGSASWVLRVQYGNVRKDWGLGGFTDKSIGEHIPLIKRHVLTLAEARDKARLGRDLAKAGMNPREIWSDKPAPKVHTFNDIASKFFKERSGKWTERHARQWHTNILSDKALPALRNEPIDDIDAPMVKRALAKMYVDTPVTAHRVKQRVCDVLDYAHGEGLRKLPAPSQALRLALGRRDHKVQHMAAVPYKELPALWSKLSEDTSVASSALRFLILAGCRSGEVRGATWSEIDLDKGEWLIPASRMKRRQAHLVPLVPAAVEILKGLEPGAPGEPVFWNILKRRKKVPLGDNAMGRRLDLHAKATVHGFRSAFTDWAADNGFANAVVEAALAHKTTDATQAAYRRTSYYDQRRDVLMPAWAAFLTGADTGDNVLAFEKRA